MKIKKNTHEFVDGNGFLHYNVHFFHKKGGKKKTIMPISLQRTVSQGKVI